MRNLNTGLPGLPLLSLYSKDTDRFTEKTFIYIYPVVSLSVSQTGVISTTAPLSRAESGRHVVSVVATDCGGKESSPVLVTVTVTPACSTAWAGTVDI